MKELTPRKIVRELDKYIIGQTQAKKSVAIAQRNRWRRQQEDEPLPVAHWERNVESMREFSRTRPDELRRDLIDHFGLPGDTATDIINTSDSTKGTVQVNTIEVTETPWRGQYFQDFPPTLTAFPKAGATFVGWSGASTSTETTIQLPIPDRTTSVTAMFE